VIYEANGMFVCSDGYGLTSRGSESGIASVIHALLDGNVVTVCLLFIDNVYGGWLSQ
jgi:hypothetical protein